MSPPCDQVPSSVPARGPRHAREPLPGTLEVPADAEHQLVVAFLGRTGGRRRTRLAGPVPVEAHVEREIAPDLRRGDDAEVLRGVAGVLQTDLRHVVDKQVGRGGDGPAVPGPEVQDALVDLYALANCRKIFGSYRSSFTDTAAAIFNTPLNILRSPPRNHQGDSGP